MHNATGQIFAHAVGVAISPLAIIAVILILAAPRGRVNALAFALGWIAAVTVLLTGLMGDMYCYFGPEGTQRDAL
ncbi:GAP family protein [Nocardia sp. NPDC020380]|uniref:GAP family protein n=1 Tax=Nocardia sp. NPDC020380 TaxID=3364309 RepID=UPI00379E4A25